MFDDVALSSAVLGNPAALQYNALKIIQDVALNGTAIVGSANNGFCQTLDVFTSITSQFVKQEDRKFNVLFPRRALTVDEVYAHLSDYDYLNTTATPANLKFRMLLDRQWVIDNAVSFDDNYNKLLIGDTFRVVMGDREFGLYYPIEFLVSKANNTMSINYAIDTVNPLKAVSSNQLIEVTDWERDGTHYLNLVFDMYQFMRRSKTITVDKENGFAQTFGYQDQFYAARVFTNTTSGWQELKQSVSQMVYDPTISTAILTPLPDVGNLRVEIPQVYFTTGLMGSQVRVDIYTTEGAVNTSIPQEDVENLECYIDTSSSPYSAPFRQPTVLMVMPYNTTLLKGGADALDFQTIRTQYIDRSLNTQVPILPTEIEALVAKYGFKPKKELDSVTDRVYVAGAAMTFEDNTQVPTVVSNVLLDKTLLQGDPSSIIAHSDELVTILPTTIFEYNQTTNTSSPVTNDTFAAMAQLSDEDLVARLNSTIYTRQPFHVVLSHADKYPTAKLFNMMNPVGKSLIFRKENPHNAARLTVSSVSVEHMVSGTGGYIIKLGVTSTSALANVSKADQRIFMTVQNKSGGTLYLEATYLTTTDTEDVYSAIIPLNYHITLDGYFTTSLTDNTGSASDCDLALTSAFDVFTCVRQSVLPGVPQDAELYGLLPDPLKPTWLVTARQSLTIEFAEDLSDILRVPVNTTWGGQVYKKYATTEYTTYGKDQFMNGTDGTIMTRVSKDAAGNNTLGVVRLHKGSDKALTGLEAKLTITTTQAKPTNVIAVDDASTALIGSRVSGQSIPVGTVVTAIDTVNNLLTLSNVPAVVTEGNLCYLANTDYQTTVSVDQSVAGDELTVADGSKALVGMVIAGFDITEGTTVKGVNGNVLTLSAPTTAAVKASALVELFNPNGPYVVLHAAGEVMLDGQNNPIVLDDLSNIYGLSIPQFDARLYAAQDSASTEYVSEISSEIVTTAHVLDPVRQKILEETKLYYRPFRTLGTATFGIGDGKTVRLPLQQSYTVTYYVSAAVKDNATLCDTIKSETISTIAQYVQSNTIISTEAIAKLLAAQFDTNVISLNVSGINNNDAYKTVALLDKDVAMSVASELDIDPNGTLYMKSLIGVSFILDPSDTSAS